jgi:hypothetical protein
MPASSYATVQDVFGSGGYLRDPNAIANAQIVTTLLGVSSRIIDQATGQFFYDDGAYTRYINGVGGPRIDTDHPFFGSSGTIGAASKGATSLTYTASMFAPRVPVINEPIVIDTGANREVVTPTVISGSGPYTLTVPATSFAHAAGVPATTIQIQIAYFENQPTAQWIQQLDGDGYTPPSNFYLWPNVPRRVGSINDYTAMKPWMGIDLPMIPISNTLWLPTTMIGKATIGITAHWGWPVVPDLIKDITCKLGARLWRKRQAGEGDVTGAGGLIASGSMRELLDAADWMILNQSGLKLNYV